MEKNYTPNLLELKKEFDFLHQKIGELEWKIATIYYGRCAVLSSEIDTLYVQLDNYRENMGIVIEKVKEEVSRTNKLKK